MARVPATRRADLEIGPHEAIASYLELAWPEHLPHSHFPAGEARDSVERVDRRTGRTYRFSPAGARLKRMGLRPGFPDFIFVLPNAQWAVAEVKSSTGELSEAQRTVRAQMLALKVAYAVWRTPENAETTITRWLNAFGLKPRAALVRRSAR